MFQAALMDIARDVCDDLRLQRPPQTLFAAYNEGDTTDRDMVRAATKTGRFLLSYHHWEHLKRTHEWSVAATAVQNPGAAIPPDFHRVVPRTLMDMSRRVLCKVIHADQWSEQRDYSAIRPTIIFNTNRVEFVGPAPSAGAKIRYSYMPRGICKASDLQGRPWNDPNAAAETPGAIKEAFTRDSDVPLWDSELFTLGMIWNLQHRDGDIRNEDYQAFLGRLHQVMDDEAPGDVLDMQPSSENETSEWDFSLPRTAWGT